MSTGGKKPLDGSAREEAARSPHPPLALPSWPKGICAAEADSLCCGRRPVFWPDPEAARPVIRGYVDQADIVKITEQEAAWLLGLDPEEALARPKLVLDRLPRARGVLVTAGERGASWCFHGGGRYLEGAMPCFDIEVADTTGAGKGQAVPACLPACLRDGARDDPPPPSSPFESVDAGDAFTGGFLWALLDAGGLEGLTSSPGALERAVLMASAAGALTCLRPGAIDSQPTLDQVLRLVADKRPGKAGAAPVA